VRPERRKAAEERRPPDRTLFETGEEYLEKSQYIKARLAFQTLINTYPDSDLAADSYLAIGDSFYSEAEQRTIFRPKSSTRISSFSSRQTPRRRTRR